MKYKLIIFSIILFSFLIIGNNAFASITNGTIDSSYHYAWGENIGWVDFANVTITDSSLSGSVYGENIGWIDLATITNNSEGILSGYAWGENVGWVDFSKTTIGTDGVFTGGAYGENIGWITFGTGENKVMTDWRPASSRQTHNSSGSYLPGYGPRPVVIPPTITPPPIACQSGENFNTTTGLPCATLTVCPVGNLFSTTTGLPCTSYQNPPVPLCSIVLTLRFGSRGNQVKCLQTILKNLSLDGIFGSKTKAAVIGFQKANNLTPDGIVGPLTRAKLN